MENRRRHYRVRPGARAPVEIELADVGLQQGAIRLLDLSAAGAGLELPEAARGRLSSGGRVRLRVRSARLPRPLDLTGQVCRVVPAEGRVQVGLRFEGWREERRRLDARLRALFNERAAFRARPARGRRVRVEVQTPRGRRMGEVVDLSITGVGVALRDAAGAQPGDAVALRLMLPRPAGPVAASGEVRHARQGERGVILGLRLVSDRREAARLFRDLQPWVAALQRAMAAPSPGGP